MWKKKQQQNTIHQGLYPAIYVPKKGEKKKNFVKSHLEKTEHVRTDQLYIYLTPRERKSSALAGEEEDSK